MCDGCDVCPGVRISLNFRRNGQRCRGNFELRTPPLPTHGPLVLLDLREGRGGRAARGHARLQGPQAPHGVHRLAGGQEGRLRRDGRRGPARLPVGPRDPVRPGDPAARHGRLGRRLPLGGRRDRAGAPEARPHVAGARGRRPTAPEVPPRDAQGPAGQDEAPEGSGRQS